MPYSIIITNNVVMKKILAVLAMMTVVAVSAMAQELNEQDLSIDKIPKKNVMSVVRSAYQVFPEAAKTLYQNYIEKYGVDADALVTSGFMMIADNDLDKALQTLDTAIDCKKGKNKETTAYAYIMKGIVYYHTGEYAKGEESLSKSIKANKKQAQAFLHRANCRAALGNAQGAFEDYQKAISIDRNNPEIKIEYARFLYENNSKDAAYDILNQLLRENPYENQVRFLKLQFCFSDEKYKEAIDEYMIYAQIEDVGFNTANLLELAIKDYDYTIQKMDNIIKEGKTKDFQDLWRLRRGHVKLVLGRDEDEGLKELQELSKNCSDSSRIAGDIAVKLANYHIGKNDWAQGIASIETAEEIARKENREIPYNWYVAKSNAYEELGNIDKAIEAIDTAIFNIKDEIKESGYSIIMKRSSLRKEKGRYTEAEADIDTLLSLFGENPALLYRKGDLETKQGNKEAGKAIYEKILEIDTVASIESYRMFALACLGRKDEAKAWAEKMIEISDSVLYSVTYYNIACMYSIMGDKAAAIENLMTAVENGFESCAVIRKDNDLDNIRDSKEFQSIEKIICAK